MINQFRERHGSLTSVGILLILYLFSAIFCPSFLSASNMELILRSIVHIALMAYGATVIISLGHINVAYGSIMAFTGCIACKLMVRTDSVVLAVLAALFLGIILGLTMGLIVTGFRIPAFIVTLIASMIVRGVVMVYADSAPILNIGRLSFLGQGDVGGVPISIYIMVICFAATWMILNKTTYGRQVIAVGENPKAAKSAGIRTGNVILKSYVLDGFFTAVAGVVYMARMNTGLPDAARSCELDVIAAVIMGGTSFTGGAGNVTGTLIGAVSVGIINNVMNLLGFNYNWQDIIKGLVVLCAVILDFALKNDSRQGRGVL